MNEPTTDQNDCPECGDGLLKQNLCSYGCEILWNTHQETVDCAVCGCEMFVDDEDTMAASDEFLCRPCLRESDHADAGWELSESDKEAHHE